MDTSDPDIRFDNKGVCNHCLEYDRVSAMYPKGDAGRRALEEMARTIRDRGRGKEYDCLIGLSGGVDSSYLACVVKDLGLRPLAVHFDSGWDSEVAVRNVERVVTSLELELHTFVVDWDEMRDLQVAFLRSGVANCDIPTDHGFTAVLWHVAAEENIPFVISGANFWTESHLPASWGYSSRDLRHLRSVHSRFGTHPLQKFPQLSLWYDVGYCRAIKGIRKVDPLNYLPYVKADAMREIEGRLGWQYYGGKHFESVFTRFFQAYYLPKRFGFDKRRAHLSSLICSGQIARDAALEEVSKPAHPEALLRQDHAYVAKKLGITPAELTRIMAEPPRSHRSFATNELAFKAINWARRGMLRATRRLRGNRGGAPVLA